MSDAAEIYYFGCWNRSGHFLFAPGGAMVDDHRRIEYFNKGQRHVDGTLAPRRRKLEYGRFTIGTPITFSGNAESNKAGDDIRRASEECEQGQFLHHRLDNGFSAIAWWDRCQGDERGACNSVVLMRGDHDAEAIEAAARAAFPSVIENLERAGHQLVEIDLRTGELKREILAIRRVMDEASRAVAAELGDGGPLRIYERALNRKIEEMRARGEVVPPGEIAVSHATFGTVVDWRKPQGGVTR